MVEVKEEETASLRKCKSCWVHEHMKDHCLMKGEEYFFKVLDLGLKTQRREDSDSSSTSIPTRSMALHLHFDSSSSTSNSVDQIRNEKVDHLESLLLLNPQDSQAKLEWPRRMFNLKRYRMLRILTFERVEFHKRGLPCEMTWLIFLRYMSFKGCILRVLPSSIGSELKEDPMATLDKLPKLQVLILQDNAFVGEKMICIKSGFKKLNWLELLPFEFLRDVGGRGRIHAYAFHFRS
ncbi:Hypothetical predicted protein [Olea europaea subsp. europaea]|uniref:Uncharacterized protein n=1 Tax=Olea europaea subsp. europaea TaxID=158383 RepID=A0A8S0V1E7_OLEEU|nr:Hypothetical predicted protein [Olea europaea subsp. europaea]